VSLAVTGGVVGIVALSSWVGSLLPIRPLSLKLHPAMISAPFLATFVDVTGLTPYSRFATAMLNR